MFKKVLYSAAALSAFGLLAGNAFAAHVIESDTDNVKVQLYGQVNRALMYVDDGVSSDTYHVDNDHGSTRFGLKGKVAIDNLTAGVLIEGEVRSNPSNVVSQAAEVSDAGTFATRHMDAYLESKQLGRLSLGQGSFATDGIAEIDLSGSKIIGYSDISKFGGAFQFRNEANDALSGTSVANVGSNLDGGRDDRIRYDSPAFAGLTLAASSGARGAETLALRYSRKVDAFNFVAGIGYEKPAGAVDSQIAGSASILLTNGLSFSLAGGKQDLAAANRDEPGYWYGKVGYKTNLINAGPTAIGIDYGTYEDFAANGNELGAMGLQVVQSLTKWGTNVYAGYRNYDLDAAAATKDIDIIMTGMQIVF